MKLDGIVVDDLNTFNEGFQVCILLGVGIGVKHPVVVELHCLGIERGAVVECDSFPKVEGVREAVLGNLP